MRCDSMCCRGKALGVALSSQRRSAVPSGPSRKRVSALRAAATDAVRFLCRDPSGAFVLTLLFMLAVFG